VSDPLLDVRDLSVTLATRQGPLRVAEEVSFTLHAGKTLGLVGESGCGKSQLALGLLRLNQPDGGGVAGQVLFEGQDLVALPLARLRDVRGRAISLVFQEASAALNPVLSVGRQVEEVLRHHLGLGRAEARRRTLELFEEVGIPAAQRRLDAYPHQLSGGMKQRVGIGMALACGPRVLIADEPTTALDVTVQAQIIERIEELQERTGLAVLWISHDLSVIAEVCDRVAVMYAGRLVELADRDTLFDHPRHPYTRALLESLPAWHAPGARLQTIGGQVPSAALGWPPGCRFAPRCTRAVPECAAAIPELRALDGGRVACIRAEEIAAEDAR
jgi:oligopeptide/dipeptide ABC transporter ATP-binding protein